MATDTPRGTPLKKFEEPELSGGLIPKERYTSQAFAQREWDRMWTRTWLLAGPVSDLPEVGSYFTFEIGEESILVVRSASERISAFYNVCQHRASRVVTEPGCGRTGAFVCPYHLWAYDLDGCLTRVPDREDFGKELPASTRLPQVQADTWGGFVFVNLDPAAKPLREYLGVLPDHLDPYDFGKNYALAQDMTFEWECNWKIGVDAFNEVYHVQGIHPELLDISDDVDCPVDLLELHSRFLFHVLRPSPRWTDERAQRAGYRDRHQLTDQVRDILKNLGVDPDAFDGDMRDVRPAMMKRLREVGELGGLDFSQLNDEQLWMDVHYTIFPNITLNISPGHFWLFRHRPHPRDPHRMFWDFQEYQRIPRGAEPGERPEHVRSKWGEGKESALHLALRQDGDAAGPLQQGMRSRGFQGLVLAHQERRIRHFHANLDGYLED